jgi:hypothetical protein
MEENFLLVFIFFASNVSVSYLVPTIILRDLNILTLQNCYHSSFTDKKAKAKRN